MCAVYCMLTSLALAVRGGLSLQKNAIPRRTPHTLAGKVVEVTKGTRVLAHSSNAITYRRHAPNRVAIDRYQCVRVLQARFVSVMNTDFLND